MSFKDLQGWVLCAYWEYVLSLAPGWTGGQGEAAASYLPSQQLLTPGLFSKSLVT